MIVLLKEAVRLKQLTLEKQNQDLFYQEEGKNIDSNMEVRNIKRKEKRRKKKKKKKKKKTKNKKKEEIN